jgi:3-hydroxyisobutyrate dehydrogenase-like beta-hydroxyacid dehydrogenase
MKWADTPRGVAEAADIVFVMVTDSTALESIASGPDGLVAGLGPGKIVIDMSTVSPAMSVALAAKVREKGADMVDSPVSGSVSTLEQGKLTMMVGGRADTFAKIHPLLLDIGPKATHVGDNGLAVSMKIAPPPTCRADAGVLGGGARCEKSASRARPRWRCSPTASWHRR